MRMNRKNDDGRNRDARKRILEAARLEMVAHGVAGARVNRIAARAETSKERVYAYFEDKDALMGAVARERMAMLQSAVHFNAEDLPGYVGLLFDFYAQHPEDARLAHWLSLAGESVDSIAQEPGITSLNERIDAIRAAQLDGTVDPTWEPLTLLSLLVSLGMAWATAPIFVHRMVEHRTGGEQMARYRAAALEAAERLVRRPLDLAEELAEASSRSSAARRRRITD